MCNTFKLKELLYFFLRPNQFTDEAGQPSGEGGQNFRGDLLRRPPHGAPDPALIRTRDSTGFEADTSKVCFLTFVLKRVSKFGTHQQSLQCKRGNSLIVSCHVTLKKCGSRVLAAHPPQKFVKSPPPQVGWVSKRMMMQTLFYCLSPCCFTLLNFIEFQ